MTRKQLVGIVPLNIGVDMPGFIKYAVRRSIEKAQREALPDLTVAALRTERLHGVHQGVWEVVAKLLDMNSGCAAAVVCALKPSPEYIHEFDWDNLAEHFGSLKKAKAWVRSLTTDSVSALDTLSSNGSDAAVRAKKGDRIEGDAARQGRSYGIAEALLEAYLLDRDSAYNVMCLDLHVSVDEVHPLTIARATFKDGGIESFRSFLS